MKLGKTVDVPKRYVLSFHGTKLSRKFSHKLSEIQLGYDQIHPILSFPFGNEFEFYQTFLVVNFPRFGGILLGKIEDQPRNPSSFSIDPKRVFRKESFIHERGEVRSDRSFIRKDRAERRPIPIGFPSEITSGPVVKDRSFFRIEREGFVLISEFDRTRDQRGTFFRESPMCRFGRI